METPLLAAALIVKNEEHFLPDCLASLDALRPLLSQVCVYDTGSTDRTIDIAEAAGARVERGYWDGDFSRARNQSIAMCNAKWVLIVDADERVNAAQTTLRQVLRDALVTDLTGADTLIVQVRNMLSEIRSDSTWPSMRVVRKGRMHYVGHLHEQVMPLRPGHRRRDLAVAEEILHLRHFGYVGDSVGIVKGARNVASAGLAVEVARGQGAGKPLAAALLDRGRSHLLRGDLESALEDFTEGRRIEFGTQSARWHGEELANTLLAVGRYAEAAPLVTALRREGSDAEICDWIDAQIAWQRGDHPLVARLLENVDRPRSAGAMTLPLADVFELRFLNALALGESDEALACGVRLMASYGRGSGHGELMLSLWGDRPPTVLAQLLFEADRGFLKGMAEEFVQYPPAGVELAASLVALFQGEAASNATAAARSVSSRGSSFTKR